MSQHSNFQVAEAERAELDRVLTALARWPRLSHLLAYMGEKVFSGQTEHLNEYNIATEVLGRSKTVFNAAEDAIARVETHRLRKRLAEFYENEGKDHPIQVTLPTGSYAPVFIHKSEATSQSFSQATLTAESETGDVRVQPSRFRKWKAMAFAAGLVLVALTVIYVYIHAGTSSRLKAEPNSAPAPAPTVIQTEAAGAPIRLLAGYSGPPRTDSAGRVWNPDQYFSAGGPWRRAPAYIARTSDPFLFENSRTGDFSYNIPLKSGVYELHLLFSTPIRSDEASGFNVTIAGEYLLTGFDINADAMGENIADERVFRDMSPGKDGFLRIGFSGASGVPTLDAIEILPGIPHAQLPIRLITQTTPFTDRHGRFWRPDDYFMHGRLSKQAHPLQDSPEPDLFSQERYGHFTYAMPVDTRGTYTLILHFAEFYFGPGASGNGGVGSRVFKVMCNGNTLLDNFDIFKEAGTLHEVTKTFYHLKPTAQGKLNLTFEPIVNNATVSGIEVLDESK